MIICSTDLNIRALSAELQMKNLVPENASPPVKILTSVGRHDRTDQIPKTSVFKRCIALKDIYGQHLLRMPHKFSWFVRLKCLPGGTYQLHGITRSFEHSREFTFRARQITLQMAHSDWSILVTHIALFRAIPFGKRQKIWAVI